MNPCARIPEAVLLAGAIALSGCEGGGTSEEPPRLAANPASRVAEEPADAIRAESPPVDVPQEGESASQSHQNAPPPGAARHEAPQAHGVRREISFDDIKFEMRKDEPFVRSMLTPQIEALHGKPVRIRGYMYPSFQQSGLTQFVLVRDNMECCFGPGAALFDCIYVEMERGKTTDYFIRPVSVAGVFHVREWVLDGRHLAIYHMTASEVR